MNVFLDCGAHDGRSVRMFRRKYPNANTYIIHSFEPNPFLEFNEPNVIFHRQAVWIKDGMVDLYLSKTKPKSLRSSIYGCKVGLSPKPISVESIDLAAWIKRNFKARDHIVLKLDVEGAEYDILERMLETGMLFYVDHLYMDWHYYKVGIPKERHDKLRDDLRVYGIRTNKWETETDYIGGLK